MLNSESIVIIRIKGEHLLYSKISGGVIGYGWGECLLYSKYFPGEYLLYSKLSGGKAYYISNILRGNVHYIVNIPRKGLLCGRFTIRHRDWLWAIKSCYLWRAPGFTPIFMFFIFLVFCDMCGFISFFVLFVFALCYVHNVPRVTRMSIRDFLSLNCGKKTHSAYCFKYLSSIFEMK